MQIILLNPLFVNGCYNMFMIVVGIDEVGRGCWAGPVVAGAVILHSEIPGLADSKVLSKQKRAILADQIYARAEVGLGWVAPIEVDSLGLTGAVGLAMRRAIQEITVLYDQVIIDGNYNFLAHDPKAVAIVKADSTIPAVSAASIVAKVARDTYMQQLGGKYEQWQFDKHVGYGTTLHRMLLEQYGISDIHRRSYKPIQALLA